MRDTDVAITSLGMISPLGLNMVQSCASIRAGISGLGEWDGYFCQPEIPEVGDPEHLICAQVAPADGDFDRIPGLMTAVLRELLQDANLSRASLEETALFLSLPPADRAGAEPDQERTLPRELRERTGFRMFEESRIHDSGHAGVFLAVRDATAMIRQGIKRRCIIAGVDSFLRYDALEELDNNGRIKSARNQDAFVPGEGGGAFLIETCASARARGAEIRALIDGIAVETETNTIDSDQPSNGEALSAAITEVGSSGDEAETFEWVMCDLNGESYRAREWGCSLVRLMSFLGGLRHLWHPADCIGDVGAATGAVLIVLAARAFHRGYAPSERALLWTSSDNGDRAVLTLRGGMSEPV
jgi:3-oxoacyl-[acyl-carrier-protein] synthase-1